jgi:hypothetical protein
MALVIGLCSAGAAIVVWREFLERDRLLLVAGVTDVRVHFGLWAVAAVCSIVLSVWGFRAFVIGYEPVTATLAALLLVAVPLVPIGAALLAALLSLLASTEEYVVLDELDRPPGRQVVVERTSPLHDTYWHVYHGGPFVYTDVTDETLLDEGCSRPGDNDKPYSDSGVEYELAVDARGRDILSIPVTSPHCDAGDAFEFALPE